MPKITIKQFGPIEFFEMDIKKLNVFIGSQASGKSTIAKTVFFCKSIKEDLIDYIYNIRSRDDNSKIIRNMNKNLRKKFISFFGPSKHMGYFEIKYAISSSKTISIFNSDDGYIQVKFSKEILNNITQIQKVVDTFLESVHNGNSLLNSDFIINESRRQSYYEKIKYSCEEIFDDARLATYIPAGRSLLTTLSDQIGDIDSKKLDYLMKIFVEKIKYLKAFFNDDLNSLLEDMKKMSNKKIDFVSVNYLISKIEKVLKGKYKFENGEEKIYISNDDYVKISFSSSGQQESIWILLLIFYLTLNDIRVFIVIEEPEAHLYPEAQKEILEIIALLANISTNEVFITTHSPYILSSLNNLIYASALGKTKSEMIEKIVDKKIWCSIEKTNAFFIENGKARDIIDTEISLIQAEAIDNASILINQTFDKLMDIDDE